MPPASILIPHVPLHTDPHAPNVHTDSPSPSPPPPPNHTDPP